MEGILGEGDPCTSSIDFLALERWTGMIIDGVVSFDRIELEGGRFGE